MSTFQAECLQDFEANGLPFAFHFAEEFCLRGLFGHPDELVLAAPSLQHPMAGSGEGNKSFSDLEIIKAESDENPCCIGMVSRSQ